VALAQQQLLVRNAARLQSLVSASGGPSSGPRSLIWSFQPPMERVLVATAAA